jgi:hypothetical protein
MPLKRQSLPPFRLATCKMASKQPPASTNQAKRARLTRSCADDLSIISDGLVCSKCSLPIAYQAEYAKLKPCGCVSCLKCLINLHAKRGTSLLSCCGEIVEAHQYHGNGRIPQGGDIIMSTEEDQETLYRERPFEYMMCDKYGSYHEIVGDKTLAVLHCSYISIENGKSQGNHITKTLLLKHDNLPDIESPMPFVDSSHLSIILSSSPVSHISQKYQLLLRKSSSNTLLTIILHYLLQYSVYLHLIQRETWIRLEIRGSQTMDRSIWQLHSHVT